MNFESKKWNSDETKSNEIDLTPFIAVIDKGFDLEKIAKEQNYQLTSDEEMEAIIANIKIEEPLEDLLKMLD